MLNASDAVPRRKLKRTTNAQFFVFFFHFSFVCWSLLLLHIANSHTQTHTHRHCVISFLPFANMHISMVLPFFHSFCATFILCIWQFCIILSFRLSRLFTRTLFDQTVVHLLESPAESATTNNVVGVFRLWKEKKKGECELRRKQHNTRTKRSDCRRRRRCWWFYECTRVHTHTRRRRRRCSKLKSGIESGVCVCDVIKI